MFKTLLLIFIGGGTGSILRFLITCLLSQYAKNTLPLATLTVNITGSLLIGLLWSISCVPGNNTYIYLLIVGFCGGYTTFSTFSWEGLNMLKNGDVFMFFMYAFLSIGLCLLSTYAGYMLGKNM